jgi:hypothetical protein
MGKPSAKIRNNSPLRVFNGSSPIAPIQGGSMSRRRLIFLAILFSTAVIAAPSRAQDNASTPATAPSGDANQSSPQITPAPPTQPAAKKVWTNDDLTDLRANHAISNAAPNAGSAKPVAKPATATNKYAKSYQDQIAKLEAQIPPLDSQIAELQSAIDGKPTGDAKESTRPRSVKIDDWSTEMQQLQQKRDDVQSRIAALEDQARSHGVAANTLP